MWGIREPAVVRENRVRNLPVVEQAVEGQEHLAGARAEGEARPPESPGSAGGIVMKIKSARHEPKTNVHTPAGVTLMEHPLVS